MLENKIVGYKRIFGFVMPDWVSESVVKNTVMGLLAVAAMLLVLIFVIWPNVSLVESKQEKLATSRTALEVLKKSKTSLDSLTSDLSATDQERILSAIPEQYSPDVAVFSLRKISLDTGVSIVSYQLPTGTLLDEENKVDKIVANEMVSFSVFPIKIVVAAPVELLLKFISEVESSLPLAVVSDLNVQEITKLSQTSSSKVVQMGLEIRYFVSTLGKVNLNKLEGFLPDDLVLAQKLRNYRLLTVPNSSEVETSIVASGSGNIFGF